MLNDRIIVIPDLHFPYAHIDALDFLSAVKKKYKPTRSIMLGDEVDSHALSFHDSDPDLDSSGVELTKALGYMETLIKMFPKMDILESNHGSLFYRKQKHHGMPRHILKSYNEIFNAPKTWKWHHELIIKLPDGSYCKFLHGAGANILARSMGCGMSLVQGHHHSLFEVRWWNGGLRDMFACSAGCLIDDYSLAFTYNKLNKTKPILGCLVIIDSEPRLIKMYLDKKGRWTGVLK